MSALTRVGTTGLAAFRVVLFAAVLMLGAGASQADREGGRAASRGEHASGGGRTYAGADRATRGGGGTYYGGGARSYGDRGGHAFGGARHVYGGGPYYGHYRYRYLRPRTFVSFGFGWPYYDRPVHPYYYAEPYPVAVESRPDIDVTNEPPSGCYYYDRFCEERFSTLDEYTDHLDSHDHARTIEVVEKESGDRLRTLEFRGGYWSVKR
jgi:hypothetical protein